jgi:hypothetical protein
MNPNSKNDDSPLGPEVGPVTSEIPSWDPLGILGSHSAEIPRKPRGPGKAARDRSRLKRSFAHYADWAWPLITGVPLTRNSALDALIAALQDVADGKTTRLLVAISPGTGKTTMLACYSSWRLARDASHRSIHASHAYDLAATESRRVRRFVEGDEFRRMFPEVKLREDESTVQHWATTADGRYFAIGTDGALTGRRAHEAVLDDPLNAIDRYSKAARDTLWAWFQESLSTRLDGDRAPIIVVQQRLDRDDLIGRLLEQGGWTLVEIPAEDEHGNPTAPNVLPAEKLAAQKQQIGAAAYATQYLQRPSDDSTAAIKRTWWRFYGTGPRPSACDSTQPAAVTPTKFDRVVLAVDMTFGATSNTADYGVVQAWGAVGAKRFLLRQWRGRATQMAQREAIKRLRRDYPHAKVLIEKAAGGQGAIEQLESDGITGVLGVGTAGLGKQARLALVSPVIEAGNCYLPLDPAAWLGDGTLADYVEELAGASKHDDSQDATAYGLAELSTGSSTRWIEFRVADERAARIAAGEVLPPEPTPHEKAMHLWFGVPLPGRPRDAGTKKEIKGACPQGHSWIDNGDGTKCSVCGATPARW